MDSDALRHGHRLAGLKDSGRSRVGLGNVKAKRDDYDSEGRTEPDDLQMKPSVCSDE